jgi:hypothetical protein
VSFIIVSPGEPAFDPGRHLLRRVLSILFWREFVQEQASTGASEARGCSACERCAILNLEQGTPGDSWGRLIFHVADVDALWRCFSELGFQPEKPHNASRDERYFHMLDPYGHELSFARYRCG